MSVREPMTNSRELLSVEKLCDCCAHQWEKDVLIKREDHPLFQEDAEANGAAIDSNNKRTRYFTNKVAN